MSATTIMTILSLAGCASGGKISPQAVVSEPATESDAKQPAKTVTFEKVYFALDDAALDDKARRVLYRNIEIMLSDPSLTFNIDGHCDDRSTDRYNLELGWRRANAVRDYLVKQGIATERLYPNSFGRAKPALIGHDESAWSRNRRVETSIRK